jgi:hypothetical protein
MVDETWKYHVDLVAEAATQNRDLMALALSLLEPITVVGRERANGGRKRNDDRWEWIHGLYEQRRASSGNVPDGFWDDIERACIEQDGAKAPSAESLRRGYTRWKKIQFDRPSARSGT